MELGSQVYPITMGRGWDKLFKDNLSYPSSMGKWDKLEISESTDGKLFWFSCSWQRDCFYDHGDGIYNGPKGGSFWRDSTYI